MNANRMFLFFGAGVLLVPCAQAQGTLAHIAAGGAGGEWQTTITVLNLGTTPGVARVRLYSDSGVPLVVPVQGQASASEYQIALPASGAASLVLSGSSSSLAVGWARVESLSGTLLRGQAIFHRHRAGATDAEAAVPLSPDDSTSNSLCIVPIPAPATNPPILLPYDNTAGFVTGFAVANTLETNQSIVIEYTDERNSVLLRETLTLTALNHTAFTLPERYSTLLNKKGVLRVQTNGHVSVLGLLFNSSGGFATLLPIYQ